MKYFLTADEHYGHANIINYSKRPFNSTEEMDAVLIENNNRVVKDTDTVYHLGDFTLRGTKEAKNYIKKLKGNHIFLRGSHDYWAEKENLPYIIEVELYNKYIVLCHYAMKSWPRSFHGSLHAYGHSHGKMERYNEHAYDVGVDCNEFAPVEVKSFIKLLTT